MTEVNGLRDTDCRLLQSKNYEVFCGSQEYSNILHEIDVYEVTLEK
jgi:hypothetical protein